MAGMMRFKPSTQAVIALLLCCGAAVHAGIPTDKKLADLKMDGPEARTYAIEIAKATAVFGLGVSVLLGFLMVIGCIVCCCRCCRMSRRDKAVAEGTFEGDKAFASSDYAYQDIGEHARKHKRLLWISTVALCIGYMACAAAAYSGVLKTQTAINKTYTGTDRFMTEMQEAMCDVNGATPCKEKSVGDFLGTVGSELGATFDGVVVWLDNLSALTQHFDDVASDTQVMNGLQTEQLAAAERVAEQMEAAAAFKVNNLYNRFDTVADERIAFELPEIEDPDTENLGKNTVFIAAISNATTEANTTLYEAIAAPDSQIVRLSKQLNSAEGDEAPGDTNLRQQALSVIDSTLGQVQDVTRTVGGYQDEQLKDYNELVTSRLNMGALVIAGVLLLPGLILLLCALCAGLCRTPKPFYLSMTFGFWVQGLYCLVAGICLLLIKVNGDVCKSYEPLLKTNLDAPLTFNGITSPALGVAALDVLTCKGKKGDKVEPDNNFVGIFGMAELFDMESELQDASTQVTSQQNTILATTSGVDAVKVAVGEVVQFPMDINGTFNATDNVANYKTFLSGVLTRLPPVDFDRDDDTSRTKFETEYLQTGDTKNPAAPAWQWAQFDTRLGTLNARLAAITTNLPDWYDNVDYALIKNAMDLPITEAGLTYSLLAVLSALPPEGAAEGVEGYFCGPKFADEVNNLNDAGVPDNEVDGNGLPLYDADVTALTLCGAAQDVQEYAKQLDERVAYNNDAVTAFTDMQTTVDAMQEDMDLLSESMRSVHAATATTLETLDGTTAAIEQSAADLVPLSQDILDLNIVFKTANEYTMCGFVGTFFSTVYLGTVCTDVQSDLRGLAGPILSVALLMFIAFYLHGCYAPALRKRPEPSATLFADSAAVSKKEKKSRRKAKRGAEALSMDSTEVLLITTPLSTPAHRQNEPSTAVPEEVLLESASRRGTSRSRGGSPTGSPRGSPRGAASASHHSVTRSKHGRSSSPEPESAAAEGAAAVAQEQEVPPSPMSVLDSPSSKPLLDAGHFASV